MGDSSHVVGPFGARAFPEREQELQHVASARDRQQEIALPRGKADGDAEATRATRIPSHSSSPDPGSITIPTIAVVAVTQRPSIIRPLPIPTTTFP
jgi:hypothetical protein